ncbi:hypothetical protein DLAC_08878 [Tieghemostelium lacteum]|uniref:Uncharacterized protein n=1 Tax=Tieghemostelium lacteum TaxID=361077 RepID=A0A151Z8L0_TIELA|nr:hypothetical protein DLAC_08878 [Tieghemostelium lacteum]|eukprot:KYQ90275.1 hypothetical protein DLAC_08878 [Tieghemostelium lacteum]
MILPIIILKQIVKQYFNYITNDNQIYNNEAIHYNLIKFHLVSKEFQEKVLSLIDMPRFHYILDGKKLHNDKIDQLIERGNYRKYVQIHAFSLKILLQTNEINRHVRALKFSIGRLPMIPLMWNLERLVFTALNATEFRSFINRVSDLRLLANLEHFEIQLNIMFKYKELCYLLEMLPTTIHTFKLMAINSGIYPSENDYDFTQNPIQNIRYLIIQTSKDFLGVSWFQRCFNSLKSLDIKMNIASNQTISNSKGIDILFDSIQISKELKYLSLDINNSIIPNTLLCKFINNNKELKILKVTCQYYNDGYDSIINNNLEQLSIINSNNSLKSENFEIMPFCQWVEKSIISNLTIQYPTKENISILQKHFNHLQEIQLYNCNDFYDYLVQIFSSATHSISSLILTGLGVRIESFQRWKSIFSLLLSLSNNNNNNNNNRVRLNKLKITGYGLEILKISEFLRSGSSSTSQQQGMLTLDHFYIQLPSYESYYYFFDSFLPEYNNINSLTLDVDENYSFNLGSLLTSGAILSSNIKHFTLVGKSRYSISQRDILNITKQIEKTEIISLIGCISQLYPSDQLHQPDFNSLIYQLIKKCIIFDCKYTFQ